MIRHHIIIVIIIIVLIILGHIVTQNYTRNFFNSISKDLKDLENEILALNTINQANIDLNTKINEIQNKWMGKYEVLAYYIEHDELEKVHTAIVKMKSYVETENFSEAMAELEEGKFVIEHIQEKNSFNLQNIF